MSGAIHVHVHCTVAISIDCTCTCMYYIHIVLLLCMHRCLILREITIVQSDSHTPTGYNIIHMRANRNSQHTFTEHIHLYTRRQTDGIKTVSIIMSYDVL